MKQESRFDRIDFCTQGICLQDSASVFGGRLVYLHKSHALQRLHLLQSLCRRPLAAALQSALHSFAKPWYKLRAVHIFRDQTNLAVNPALWSSIRDALDQSLFFILFASPEAAASPWVAKEAEYWISRNGTSHILIVLTGGTLKWDHLASCFTLEHTNSLPQSLLARVSRGTTFPRPSVGA